MPEQNRDPDTSAAVVSAASAASATATAATAATAATGLATRPATSAERIPEGRAKDADVPSAYFLQIDIENFALIDRLSFTPSTGLLILSGETGAGKSLLIGAIGALTGRRVSREMIRHGADLARVEAVLSVTPAALPEPLRDACGLDSPAFDSRTELILSREILSSGRTTARINGRLVPLNLLAELTSVLIDLHGQHEQQGLFQVDQHQELLDRYGAVASSPDMDRYRAKLAEFRLLSASLRAYGDDPAARARQQDLLAYQIEEITAAQIEPDEDSRLTERRRIVSHAERIRQTLDEAAATLEGDDVDSGVLAGIGAVISRIDSVARFAKSLEEIDQRLRASADDLQALGADIRALRERIAGDPQELLRIDERLNRLHDLKRKYGTDLAEVARFRDRAADELERMRDGEAEYDRGQLRAADLRQELYALAQNLHRKRLQFAGQLQRCIGAGLAALDLKGAEFGVSFADLPEISEALVFGDGGLDHIEFVFSANAGEPARPLARIASGGEASRIMLAIRGILADADRLPILVFDEIDAGIGGRTAGKVGEQLEALAEGRQIFCITHMAQIAAMADEHWLIAKAESDGRTRTTLRRLDAEGRSSEVARLLSGGVGDSAARQLADALRERKKRR